MKRLWFGSATILMGIVLATAWAQQPPPERPSLFGIPLPAFGPPPGFGPPGRGPFESQNVTVTLLGMPEVQKELALSESQAETIRSLGGELRKTLQESAGEMNFQELEKLSPEERARKFADLRSKSEETQQGAETKHLEVLHPEQLARLKQLKLQYDGPAAFHKDEVKSQLGLTAEQLQRIDELAQQAQAGFGPPQLSPQLQGEVLAVFSPEQRKAWASLTGTEFNFPRPRPSLGGPPGPPPGFGPPGGEERKLLAKFDANKDGWLNAEERQVARTSSPPAVRRGPGGPGGPPGMRHAQRESGKPGVKINPDEVATFNDASLYDPTVLRTLFLEFENPAWEAELEAFHGSDVDVPARMIVDGQAYEGVGVHFRGMSSFGMVPAGSKRSLNVSLDLVNSKQRLNGYKTLNLLNAHEDPTFMKTVLYSQIARNYIPAPKANFVRVVINGESWGLYTNVQQFDKIFLTENYGSDQGSRWKVSGSPMGRGGLEYSGDDVAEYKKRFELKSKENDKSWQALIQLCKTLNTTPTEQLETAITPLLDLDSTLWFLALDCALQNGDGYWTRASDYSIYLDERGVFHIVPHDMNETFHAGGGPGMFPGGPPGFPPPGMARNEGRGRYSVDPLIGLADESKPLRSKLLSVPSLRERYLRNVKTIAEKWLNQEKLEPLIAQHRELIEAEVAADTRKLSSLEEFRDALAAGDQKLPRDTGGSSSNLFLFAKQRREYLLNHSAIKSLK